MTVSLARDADLYGSSFIFEGNRIIGKFATCKIKSRIVEEKLIHLAVDCSTVITTQPQQFTLKIIGEDRILRIFPDMPEMEVAYDRGLF